MPEYTSRIYTDTVFFSKTVLRVCKLYTRSTVASRNCGNPLSTGILLYTGSVFAAPERPSYILYNIIHTTGTTRLNTGSTVYKRSISIYNQLY
jgi:hypothetical protein